MDGASGNSEVGLTAGTKDELSQKWRERSYGRNVGSPRKHSGLTTLAYNLKRVLNLVSFEKLMSILRRTALEDGAAVGVKVPQRA